MGGGAGGGGSILAGAATLLCSDLGLRPLFAGLGASTATGSIVTAAFFDLGAVFGDLTAGVSGWTATGAASFFSTFVGLLSAGGRFAGFSLAVFGAAAAAGLAAGGTTASLATAAGAGAGFTGSGAGAGAGSGFLSTAAALRATVFLGLGVFAGAAAAVGSGALTATGCFSGVFFDVTVLAGCFTASAVTGELVFVFADFLLFSGIVTSVAETITRSESFVNDIID